MGSSTSARDGAATAAKGRDGSRALVTCRSHWLGSVGRGGLAPALLALLFSGCATDLQGPDDTNALAEDAEVASASGQDGSASADRGARTDDAGPQTDAELSERGDAAGFADAEMPADAEAVADAAAANDARVPDPERPDAEPARDASPPVDAEMSAEPDAGGSQQLPVCDCFVRAAWCAEGVLAEVEARDMNCRVPLARRNPDALLGCEGNEWVVLEDCDRGCEAQPPGSPDACAAPVLPVCDCFVQVAWCGSGVAQEAEEMGCRVPLLPEHNGDILACNGNRWVVGQACNRGCVEAPAGVPDSCHDEGTYRLPYGCGDRYSCTNGNHSNTHTGTDEFAYDFGVPRGTPVLAMRAGRVHRVRNVSSPGDRCYDTGDRDCANLANTVEILHADGTIGLYMHLRRGTVAEGAQVRQGQQIGLSGNSGWSTGPHVHVQVQRNCGIWWCQSIRFGFAEDANLVVGETPRSQNCP